ncbi:MAG: hypothetical protein JXR83_01415 [Deltaproteobacteria bacterium]|nr:hypothetical protein [Deltaproteobacteria bacterium]
MLEQILGARELPLLVALSLALSLAQNAYSLWERRFGGEGSGASPLFSRLDPTTSRVNSCAERTLRPAVMWHKTSFGTQSKAGSRFAERILTVTASLRLQDRHVLSYLSSAIAAHRNNDLAPSLLPQTTTCAPVAA